MNHESLPDLNDDAEKNSITSCNKVCQLNNRITAASWVFRDPLWYLEYNNGGRARWLKSNPLSGLILALQGLLVKQGCIILQPYDVNGRGTFNPATTLRTLVRRMESGLCPAVRRRPMAVAMGTTRTVLQMHHQVSGNCQNHPLKLAGYISSLCWPSALIPKNTIYGLLKTTGRADTGRVGLRLGSLVWQHGNFTIYILPTSRWIGL